jgi:hypothetical protein
MHQPLTREQVKAVSRMLLDEFESVSWDGDQVSRNKFTESLIPFIERAHDRQNVASTVLPRVLPDLDGTSTLGGDHPLSMDGAVPKGQAITDAEYVSACEYLDENLAADWRSGFKEDMEGYMALAAANRRMTCPDVVIWMLDETRSPSRFAAWACLGEYRSFDCDRETPTRLIGTDGRVLTAAEIERAPWYPMLNRDLTWTEACKAAGAL